MNKVNHCLIADCRVILFDASDDNLECPDCGTTGVEYQPQPLSPSETYERWLKG